MVNWLDPSEIQRDAAALLNLNHVFFGLLFWEIFVTSDFEWSLLTLKRSFRWPFVSFFFLGRYFMVFAAIGLITSYAVTTPINCSALYTFNTFCLNLSVLSATTSLFIRVITLWENKLFMAVPLAVFSLGHWVILLRGAFITESSWDSMIRACTLSFTQPVFLSVMLFYTMAFQLVLFVAACVAMARVPSKQSMVSRLFFGEGIFFFFAFAISCIPPILNALHLNPIMDIIAIIPAAVVSVICACRVVLLSEFYENGTDYSTHSMTNMSGGRIVFRPQGPRRGGVHVTTEHVVTTDEQSKSYSSPETDNGDSEFSLSDKQLEAQYIKETGPSAV